MYKILSAQSLRKQVIFLGFIVLSFALPQLSHASLIGQSVTVTYQEDTPFSSSDTVTVGADVEISSSDTSKNLTHDSILLDGDFIDINATSIVIQLSGGGADMGSGYTNAGFNLFPGARFKFTGFSFAPDVLSGVGLVLTNAIGLTDADVSFTANSLTLNNLGNLGILGSTVGNHGQIALNLQTQPAPVPVPGMLPLFTACLAGFGVMARRQKKSGFGS